MILQRTIRQQVNVEGIGLHAGQPASLTFCPAPQNTGIHFIRNDLPGKPTLEVSVDHVVSTENATTLGNKHFQVSTVEHCLSALSVLRIDNLNIELQGPEIPIIDGSAVHYLNALLKAGLVEQNAIRKYARILKPIEYEEGEKSAKLQPYNGLRISCTIEFPHKCIGTQKIDFDINQYSFSKDIAPARTFGFLEEAKKLWARGLALGGSLDNTIVLDNNGIMNKEGLRFPDEFVRHKVLDALGDLTTLGLPLLGHLTLHKAGHSIMNKLMKKILNSPQHCSIMELSTEDPVIINF